MLVILRFINALIALVVAWFAVVMSLVLLFWFLWDYLAGPFIGKIVIPEPPALLAFLFVPTWLGLIIVGFFFLMYLLKPAGMITRGILRGSQYDCIDQSSPLYSLVQCVATKMGMRLPKIFLYNSEVPNAFAVSSLFTSSISISLPLIESLERDEIEWVIAHELAHIDHFDSGAATFWIASAQTMRIAWSFHNWIMRLIVSSAVVLRLSLVVIAFILWPLFLLNYSIIFVNWVARECFLLLDLHIGRAMEYRADKAAARYQGAAVGVRALSKLRSGIEPSLGGLFSTHPPGSRRINRLLKMAEKQLQEIKRQEAATAF